MKYALIALALILTGCASTPSEYSQGCQDGVTTFYEGLIKQRADSEVRDDIQKGCDNLDLARSQNQARTDRPRGRSER